ncbi:MAG: hypothetical protein ABJI33_02690 [Balneola sp.]
MFCIIKLREKNGKSTLFTRDDTLDEDGGHQNGDGRYVIFFLSLFKDSN